MLKILFEHILTYLCVIQKRNRDQPITKCKIEFSKALQSLCTAKSKNKPVTFTYKFSRNHCFNFSFKGRFQESFLVKVICTKNTLHALNSLISRGNNKLHILK